MNKQVDVNVKIVKTLVSFDILLDMLQKIFYQIYKKHEIKKAVIYARFSSDNQRNAQVRAIRDYCSNNNMIVVKTYIDEALSGTSADDRVQFLQMIYDSKKGLFEFVLVHKFREICQK